jgi:hypothetical protein
MMIKRMFAGSIVALLLSVSSFAAACDISCAFAAMSSDCHSQQTYSQDLAPGGMKMDGMAMAGMAMPGIANGEEQQAVPAISRLKASHPSIGEMGPCERQSCDNGSAVFARTTRFGDSHFHSILAIAETPRGDGALTLLRGARDDIATYQVRDGIPLHLRLRI